MSDTKDLSLLFLAACFNAVFFSFGFFYTYNITYVKVFHPEYPVHLIYTVIIPLNITVMIMNAVYPYLVAFAGIRNCFRLFGILVSLQMIFAVYWPSLAGLYVSHFFFGAAHQLMVMNIIFYINVRFKSNLVRYTGYVFTGTAVSFLWGPVFSKIVNPNNEPKSVKFVLPSGDVEHTFSKEVSLRFPLLCLTYAVCNVIVSFFISFCISPIESNLSATEDSLSLASLPSRSNLSNIPTDMHEDPHRLKERSDQKDSVELVTLPAESQDQDLDLEKRKQAKIEMIKENLITKNKKTPKSETKILFSLGFMSVFLLTCVKSYTNFFFNENLKEIGIYFMEDDGLVTILALVGAIFNFLIRFAMGSLYEVLGLKLLYLANMCCEMIQSLILINFGRSLTGYVIYTFIFRSSAGKRSNLRNALHPQLHLVHQDLGLECRNQADEVLR